MNKPTKEYSAMLYALADEIEAEEGCTTESHETVREAAQRMDELTVTIRGMEIQRGRAERALLRAGFTFTDGAEEWKPPIGPSSSPILDRIDVLERQRDQLLAALENALSRQSYKPGHGPEWYEKGRSVVASVKGGADSAVDCGECPNLETNLVSQKTSDQVVQTQKIKGQRNSCANSFHTGDRFFIHDAESEVVENDPDSIVTTVNLSYGRISDSLVGGVV
jgi:hypothetical protein